jgi:hypothetical protein
MVACDSGQLSTVTVLLDRGACMEATDLVIRDLLCVVPV